MGKEQLYTLASKAQNGDENSMLLLIDRFTPVLNRYARALRYEDAYNDLVVALLSAIKKLDLCTIRITSDPGIINYFVAVVYHEFISLSKKARTREKHTVLYDDMDESIEPSELDSLCENYDSLLYGDFSKHLTKSEAEVLRLHYFHRCTVQDIAYAKNISRQAVNKMKLRALKKLRREYFM